VKSYESYHVKINIISFMYKAAVSPSALCFYVTHLLIVLKILKIVDTQKIIFSGIKAARTNLFHHICFLVS
jgi:hypothetical protein